MKQFALLLFLMLQLQIISAQYFIEGQNTLRESIFKKKEVVGYAMQLDTPTDTIEVTFLKGTPKTQLINAGPQTLWLGKFDSTIHYSDNTKYSELIIKFSKAVTSINFTISHINFDFKGQEYIQLIEVSDTDTNNIISTSIFDWITGPASGIDSSIAGITKLNRTSPILHETDMRVISANQESNGIAASGRLLISNKIPFNQIILSQKVIFGWPNGILINTDFNYTLAKVDKRLNKLKYTADSTYDNTLKNKSNTLSQISTLKVGDQIKLDRVFFKQSVPKLLAESYHQLDTLIILLNKNPSLKIEIQGNTDNQGREDKNLQLSIKRAIVVKNYLISEGINADRLTHKGFGGSNPLIDNDTEEHRKLNRRVEFMITER